MYFLKSYSLLTIFRKLKILSIPCTYFHYVLWQFVWVFFTVFFLRMLLEVAFKNFNAKAFRIIFRKFSNDFFYPRVVLGNFIKGFLKKCYMEHFIHSLKLIFITSSRDYFLNFSRTSLNVQIVFSSCVIILSLVSNWDWIWELSY